MNTQEVRIPWVWDTTGVERGAKTMENAAQRVQKAMTGGGGANSGAGSSSHGRGNNFVWALRDLAEGRTGYAIMRLLSGLRASATNVAAISVGYVLAQQFAEAREELDKLAKGLREFGEQNREASRKGTFATVGMGGTELSLMGMGQFRAAQKTSGGIMEAESETRFAKHPLNATVEGLDKFGRMGATALGIPVDSKTDLERAFQQADLDRRVAARGDTRLQRIASRAYEAEAGVAEQWKNPHNARFAQIGMDMDTAKSLAKEAGASPRDIENIGRKFAAMITAVEATREVERMNFQSAADRLDILGGPKSGTRRGLALAEQQRRHAQRLLDSGMLTEPEERAATLQLMQAGNARNETLMGLYLRSDGRRRRAADIHRDLRNERHTERRRARFLRTIDGIDPLTGYHRVNREVGLHSGGLSSGGLTSGNLFGSMDKIFEVLNARLPKEAVK